MKKFVRAGGFLAIALLVQSCVQRDFKVPLDYSITTEPAGAACIFKTTGYVDRIESTPGILNGRKKGTIDCAAEGFEKKSLWWSEIDKIVADPSSYSDGRVQISLTLEPLENPKCPASHSLNSKYGAVATDPLTRELIDPPEPHGYYDIPIETLISDYTVLTGSDQHGYQVEYVAKDGNAYLWYPGNSRIVKQQWKIEGEDICFRSPSNTYNPVTRTTGGDWQCGRQGLWTLVLRGRLAGDVFGLSKSENVPYSRSRDDAPEEFNPQLARWFIEGCEKADYRLAPINKLNKLFGG